MKSKPPQPLTRFTLRMVAKMSSVLSARCCSPGPSLCSRYIWIWLLRRVPKVGSLTGMMTISLLLASTMLFRPAPSTARLQITDPKAAGGRRMCDSLVGDEDSEARSLI